MNILKIQFYYPEYVPNHQDNRRYAKIIFGKTKPEREENIRTWKNNKIVKYKLPEGITIKEDIKLNPRLWQEETRRDDIEWSYKYSLHDDHDALIFFPILWPSKFIFLHPVKRKWF